MDCYFSWSVDGPSSLLNSGIPAVDPISGAQQNPDIIFNNGVFHIVYREVGLGNVIYRTGKLVMDGRQLPRDFAAARGAHSLFVCTRLWPCVCVCVCLFLP